MKQIEEKQLSDGEALQVLKRVNCPQPTNAAQQDFQALVARDAEGLAKIGDALSQVETALIKQLGPSYLTHETVRLKLTEMRQELGVTTAAAEEKLLIDAICLTWLRLCLAEQAYSQAMSKSTTLHAGLYWERRLDGAQRRHRKTIETLARVRKLLRRDYKVQINVATEGGQQFNQQT